MDAKTAKYTAIACFGLAGALAVFSLTGAFERTADVTPTGTCEYIAPPAKGEIIPFGDWCVRLIAGQTFHIRTRHVFEYDTSGLPEARIDVYDPDDRRYLNLTRTEYAATPSPCFRLTDPYSRIEITALKFPGFVRIRVGEPVNWKDKLTNCSR